MGYLNYWRLCRLKTPVRKLGLCSPSDVITFDQNNGITYTKIRQEGKFFPTIPWSEWLGQLGLEYAQKCFEIGVKNSEQNLTQLFYVENVHKIRSCQKCPDVNVVIEKMPIRWLWRQEYTTNRKPIFLLTFLVILLGYHAMCDNCIVSALITWQLQENTCEIWHLLFTKIHLRLGVEQSSLVSGANWRGSPENGR